MSILVLSIECSNSTFFRKFKNEGMNRITMGYLRHIALLLLLSLGGSVRAADYYWVNGTGNWSDYAHHWATSSGGAVYYTKIPDFNDNVHFDTLSFTATNQTVVLDRTFIYCQDMDWTGARFSPILDCTIPQRCDVYGSLVLKPQLTVTKGRFHLLSTGTGNTIATYGLQLDSLIVEGAGGTFSLQSTLNATNLFFNDVNLISNNNTIISGRLSFYANSGRKDTCFFGTSAIHARYIACQFYAGHLDFSTASVYQDAANDTLYGDLYNVANYACAGNLFILSGEINATYISITGSCIAITSYSYLSAQKCSIGGNLEVYQANFDTLNFTLPGAVIRFDLLNVYNSLSFISSCAHPVYFGNYTPCYLYYHAAALNWNSVYLDNVVGSMAVSSQIYTNCSLAGVSSGFNLTQPSARTVYWIGGSGDWNDSGHWSLSNNGPGGACPPDKYTDVNFTASSTPSGKANLTFPNLGYCHDIVIQGLVDSLLLGNNGDGGKTLVVSGSAIFHSLLKCNIGVELNNDSIAQFLTTNGASPANLILQGYAEKYMNDSLYVGQIYHHNGLLNTLSHPLVFKSLTNYGAGNVSVGTMTFPIFPAIDFGHSHIYVDSMLNMQYRDSLRNTSNADLNVGIPGHYSAPILVSNDAVQFDSVHFNTSPYYYSGFNVLYFNFMDVDNAIFLSYAAPLSGHVINVHGSFSFDTLSVDSALFDHPGQSVYFRKFDVHDYLRMNGSCDSLSQILGFGTGLYLNAAQYYAANLKVQGVHVLSGAPLYVYNSVDGGGNTGVVFTNALKRKLFWVSGTGDWNNSLHWSLVNGGTGGECPPLSEDDVELNDNSFTTTTDTVKVSVSSITCKNITFNCTSHTPVFNASSANLITHGSVVLSPGMKFNCGYLTCNPDSDMSIITSGVSLNSTSIAISSNFTCTLPSVLKANSLSLGVRNIDLSGDSIFVSSFHFTSCPDTLDTMIVNLSNTYFKLTSYNDIVGPKMVVSGRPFINFYGSSSNTLYGQNSYGKIIMSGTTNSIYGHFLADTMIVTGDAFFGSPAREITDLTVNGNVQLPWSDTLKVGSLHLNNPAKTVSVSVLKVKKGISTTASGGFPVKLRDLTQHGYIISDSAEVCLNNLLINNISVGGGALFFAGMNSVDMGGNYGWLWLNCSMSPPDVWPGDANSDGSVDNHDILPVGLGFGYHGPVRPNASLSWIAQPDSDWMYQFATGANLKYADCDGNGTVNFNDTLAISLNYGNAHPLRPANYPVNPAYAHFEILPYNTSYVAGDTLAFDVVAGQSQTPLDSLYGLAFSIDYDTQLIDTGWIDVSTASNWMKNGNPNFLQLYKNRFSTGVLQLGMSRTDHQNTAGFGTLCTVRMKTRQSVNADSLHVSVSNIEAIDAQGYPVSLLPGAATVVIVGNTTALNETAHQTSNVLLFPNPATDFTTVKCSGGGILEITLMNAYGVQKHLTLSERSSYQLYTGDLNSGIYVLKVSTTKGLSLVKLVVSGH